MAQRAFPIDEAPPWMRRAYLVQQFRAMTDEEAAGFMNHVQRDLEEAGTPDHPMWWALADRMEEARGDGW